MMHHRGYLRFLFLTSVPAFLIALPAFSASDTFNAPAMLQPPAKGRDGSSYLVDVFTQVCVSNANNIERITQMTPPPEWHGSFSGKNPTFKLSTGRVGFPEIVALEQPNGAICAVTWTIDPNQGVNSVQPEIERRMRVKLDGSRITTSPSQTVFTGFGGYDANGTPKVTLSENISEKRASFQLILNGKWKR